MITHQINLTINRPVEEVFAFLTNEKNHPKWDKLSVVMECQEAGPWRKGMKFREVRKVGGRDTEVFSQIVDFEPNRHMEIRSITGPDFHGNWQFQPAGNGTQLVYQAEMKFKGPMRLLEPVISGQFKKQLQEN